MDLGGGYKKNEPLKKKSSAPPCRIHNECSLSNLNFNCSRYKMKEKVGENEWNNLDKDLKELKNAKALKKKVINNLLSKQNSNINFL